ncbi:MAG: hypothetical protein RMJ97_00315, partial [Raineya sp.]|nr:hypothetical protein [Raineya sp.]
METQKTAIWWQIFKEKPYFWIGALLFWLISGVCLLIFSKAEIHLTINEWHTTFGDWIFPKITYLGEASVYVLMGMIFLYKKDYRKLWAMLIAVLLHVVMVQTLKNFLFPAEPRPISFFEGFASLNFVEGVEVHRFMSFPSGHTATAFSAFALIAF